MIVNKALPQPSATCNPYVTNIDIFSINEEHSSILVNCLDDDKTFIGEAGFCYKGENKNVPFTLTDQEIATIKREG